MKKNAEKRIDLRWLLFLYDFLIFLTIDVLLLILYRGYGQLTPEGMVIHTALSGCCIFLARFGLNIYRQIWRYGGIQCYIRLLISDAIAFFTYLLLNYVLPIPRVSFTRLLASVCMNCLAALAIRMIYRYVYKTGNLKFLLKITSLNRVKANQQSEAQKINIAILGAGRVGVNLAEELLNNPSSAYRPRCFIETDAQKIGREIHNLPVLAETDLPRLKAHEIQEIVFAVPQMDKEQQKALYQRYKTKNYKVKIYDYPMMQAVGGKRQLREFDVEELLFRKPLVVTDEKTVSYYKDKVVLITGGGGSIGSELCRQLAKMQPKQLIILDVYENGAYDIQQELKIAYKGQLDVRVVIVSVCNRKGLERAFRTYRPQIVINAAAHKHVPFMEDDCIEAVENNVFGTLNSVELAEQYGAERFIMVSTDKAVNPTNVMGATKRMCEMIVLSHSGGMTCSATRFGNVLGSAGSVIPLFKRQIAAGGPVTVTDKRVIRYFMTIPEASQLVLQSGAMAKNKELFVLDMGQPVKIWDLAENMIRLSGQTGITIQETGLRPGEKLYEELLVKTEELDKTENELIYIERDKTLTREEIAEKLAVLRAAVATDSNDAVRRAMMQVVPTFRAPQEVNRKAEEAIRQELGG